MQEVNTFPYATNHERHITVLPDACRLNLLNRVTKNC